MRPQLPDLVKMYLRNIAIGFLLSAMFVSGLLYLDVLGLWGLVTRTQGGWIAVMMMFMFNGMVFAGVQFAISIMLMADDNDGDDKGHRDPIALCERPVPVEIRDRH